MSERCEPPEELRGVDGWHWVQIADWPPTVNRWVWDAHERLGFWHPHISEGTRYLAPVATPAEVDALRAERDDWKRLCFVAEPDVAALKNERDALHAEASEYCQTVQLLEDRNASLRARVEALETALQPFADTAAWVSRQWRRPKPTDGIGLIEAPEREANFTVRDLNRARAALGDTP